MSSNSSQNVSSGAMSDILATLLTLGADTGSSPPSSPSTPRAPTMPSHKKPSAFCGEYYNSTRIDDEFGVLGNECFVNGLSFVPNVALVLIAVPVLISWNMSMGSDSVSAHSWVRFPHHTLRWLLYIVITLVNILEVVAGFLSDELLSGVHLHLYIPHIVSAAGTLAAIVYYHSVEMWNSPRFLLLLIPYWLASVVMEILKTWNLNIMQVKLEYMRPHLSRASLVCYLILLLIELDVLRQLRYAFFRKRRLLKPPESLACTGYVQGYVSLPSKATYFWMGSIISQAVGSHLELTDLGQLPESEMSGNNYTRLMAALEEERERQKTSEQVASCLWKSFWVKSQSMLIVAGLLMIAGSALHLSTPVILINILHFVENRSRELPTNVTNLPKDGDMVEIVEFLSNGYVLAITLFLTTLVMNTLLESGNYLIIREGIRLRGALQMLIYSKILSLSSSNFSNRSLTFSQVVSRISIDTNNIMLFTFVCHFIWLIPLKTLAALIMLFAVIGWTAIVSLFIVIALSALQYLLSSRLAVLQAQVSMYADTRLRRCKEMLQNVKPLKLYAWEGVLGARVEDTRVAQVKVMVKVAIIKAISTCINEGGLIITLTLAFTLYPYIQYEPLIGRIVFPSIILYDVLMQPIQLFSVLLNFTLNANASTKRIADFLNLVDITSTSQQTQKSRFQKVTFQTGEGDSGHSSFSVGPTQEVPGSTGGNFPPPRSFQSMGDTGVESDDGGVGMKKAQNGSRVMKGAQEGSKGRGLGTEYRPSNAGLVDLSYTSMVANSEKPTSHGELSHGHHSRGKMKGEGKKSKGRKGKRKKHNSGDSKEGGKGKSRNRRNTSAVDLVKEEAGPDEVRFIIGGDNASDVSSSHEGTPRRSVDLGSSKKKPPSRLISVSDAAGRALPEVKNVMVTTLGSRTITSSVLEPPGGGGSRLQPPAPSSLFPSFLDADHRSFGHRPGGSRAPSRRASLADGGGGGGREGSSLLAELKSTLKSMAAGTGLGGGGQGFRKRADSVTSITASIGSQLDDDDMIDPNRDVGVAVKVEEGVFAWEPDREPVLSDINLRIDAGKLTVIVGPIGSGKTALIAALLGELTRLSGKITWKPGISVCYAGSTPWILNATVQENILFGRPFEKKRYRRVLKACALAPDISILPQKDQTEIGDKGIGLSVGQRTRICIARAIYSKADLVILDDPFTSLDLPTAAHIFEDAVLHFCINKRRRTVVLVTHELHFLPSAHVIYGMEGGFLTCHGKLVDVKENNTELFENWKQCVKEARLENQSRAEREDTTHTERLILLRKIRTLEFKREAAMSTVEEEAGTGNVGERVFIAGQTHISIEEEHPGVEEDEMRRSAAAASAADDDDLNDLSPVQENNLHDIDIHNGMAGRVRGKGGMRGSGQKILKLVDLKRGGRRGGNAGLPSHTRYEGEKARFRVTPGAILAYLRACFIPLAVTLMIFQLLRLGALVAGDVWLTRWTAHNRRLMAAERQGLEVIYPKPSLQRQLSLLNRNSTVWPRPTPEGQWYMSIYSVVMMTALILCILISFGSEFAGVRAAKALYFNMLRSVLRVPMRFFDANPISRIMSRFSGDISVIDEKLSTTIEHFVRTLLLFLAALAVNAAVTPYFCAPAAIVLVFFLYVQSRYRSAYRELHKLDSITKAPLLTHCVETLNGLRTIRAFKDEGRFWKDMEKHVDINNCTHLWLNTANRWAGIRLDYLSSVLILCSVVTGIIAMHDVPSSLIALGITYTLLLSGYINWAVRSIADIDVQMTAVQRVHEYTSLKPECSNYFDDSKIESGWPTDGEIVFKDVSIRYVGSSEPVVRSVSLHIRPGEKIGICGRPGSGKSSLTLALFRLVDICEGTIYIDGTDIQEMSAHFLRSKLSVLPQDCTLFAGTVRFNLDPEDKCSDDEIWEALDQVNLKNTVKYLSGQLEGIVAENGDNFSLCEKQLMCLARVVLKKSKVVIIDEVMSVINVETERILRSVIRSAFNGRTIINLSHRAAALMHYDKVIVLDNGQMVEYDSPHTLASNPSSVFTSLLLQTATPAAVAALIRK